MPLSDRPLAEAAPIVLLSRGLEGGGVQRMMRHLADELLARGFRVDHLVAGGRSSKGARRRKARTCSPAPCPGPIGRLIALRADPGGFQAMLKPVFLAPIAACQLGLIPALTRYLKDARPDGLIAPTTYMNLTAIWARMLANAPTRVLVRERMHLFEGLRSGRSRRAWRWRRLPGLLHRAYAMAGGTKGGARDLESQATLPAGSVHTIYNPTFSGLSGKVDDEGPDEPWMTDSGPPVILTAGRLVVLKDLPTLIRGFAELRVERPARLVFLGKGTWQERLERFARDMGVRDDIRFVGWTSNVSSYVRHASVFALNSMREGFLNVLIEALALGCPVVATDCPGGPAEVFDGGRMGRLVPVGDHRALARELAASLDAAHDKDTPLVSPPPHQPTAISMCSALRLGRRGDGWRLRTRQNLVWCDRRQRLHIDRTGRPHMKRLRRPISTFHPIFEME